MSEEFQIYLNSWIDCAKEKFHNRTANKWNDTQENAKAYSSLIKRFLCNKKIPLTFPLHYDNCLITDSKEKADFFSSFKF